MEYQHGLSWGIEAIISRVPEAIKLFALLPAAADAIKRMVFRLPERTGSRRLLPKELTTELILYHMLNKKIWHQTILWMWNN